MVDFEKIVNNARRRKAEEVNDLKTIINDKDMQEALKKYSEKYDFDATKDLNELYEQMHNELVEMESNTHLGEFLKNIQNGDI